MDENYENNITESKETDIKNFSMDESGNLRGGQNTAAAIGKNARTFLILGWVSAAFTAFISPLFAIAGIVFGVLANGRIGGSGNAVIITNIVLAVLNMVFSFFLIRGFILGY
ncbi:MAG: hypothetical protein ACOX7R_12635 [Acetivibrionales bacterium]|jgi:hypothetical protein